MTSSDPTVTLHGLWTGGLFHLWGERHCSRAVAHPVTEPVTPDSNAGRQPSAPRPLDPLDPSEAPPRHPRALSVEQLHAAAGELCGDGLLAAVAAESVLALWLPCQADEPASGAPICNVDPTETVDHPPATGPTEPQSADWVVRPWQISTLTFAPAEALDLLASISPSGDSSTGSSLRYWAQLAGYVVSALMRKQFIPALHQSPDGNLSARWRLVVQDRHEHQWLEEMATAMPPVCRAVHGDQTPGSNGRSKSPADSSNPADDGTSTARPLNAAALLESFLHATVDATIRRNLAADSFFDQIHERAATAPGWDVCWLSALLAADPTIQQAQDELAQVIGQLQSWLSRADQAGPDASARLCLALDEPTEHLDSTHPEDHKLRWRLRLFLESAEDGRVLPIEAAPDDESAPSVLQSRLTGHREFLVAELTRAVPLFPQLERTLSDPCPTEVYLSTSEAHDFIRRGAPLLEGNGIRTVLPEWATRTDHYLGLKLIARPGASAEDSGGVSLSRFGLESVMEFNWRLAVGDNELSAEDVKHLASTSVPLVRLHGQWLEVDPDKVRAALDFVERHPGGQGSLGELLRLGSGAINTDSGLPVVGLQGASWLEQLLGQMPTAHLTLVDQPAAFCGTLRDYQGRGLSWLVFLESLGLGACLADDMGLGKTIQLIALLLHERQADEPVGPTLLLAPMSVVGNWRREIERFAPSLRVLVYQGADRPTGEAFDALVGQQDVVLATYGLVARSGSDLTRVRWHRVALDEAQKIKNPNTAQARAIRSLSTLNRVALTGTPIENHLSDLWSISEFLNPGLLQSASEFRTRFAVPIEKLGDKERSGQLRRLIRPFLLRRLKSDPEVACDLPEKMEMRVFCNLTVEQAHHYELIVNDMLGAADSATGIRRRAVILAGLTRLKQVCNHPRQFLRDHGPLEGRSGKCERLVEMLEEVMEEGEAALVFTQYRQASILLHELLNKHLDTEVLLMHGGSSAAQRDQMVERFQEAKGDTRVFVLSLKTGGFGLNLTAACHVFHFDRWWNPAVEAQATDRTHRIGQTRRVQVHKFVCIGTIEERIDQLLEDKRALAEEIMSSGDSWLTNLSTKELGEYIRLSSEAVAEG